MIFVSEIKDKLELELNEYEFQTDIENIKKIDLTLEGQAVLQR